MIFIFKMKSSNYFLCHFVEQLLGFRLLYYLHTLSYKSFDHVACFFTAHRLYEEVAAKVVKNGLVISPDGSSYAGVAFETLAQLYKICGHDHLFLACSTYARHKVN